MMVLPLFLPSTLEADLKWLVLPLFPTLILEADLITLVLPLFLTLIPEAAHKLLVLLLVLSEAAMMVVVVLNKTLYLMSMSCPIIETWYLIEPKLLNNIRLLTSM